ncbi:DNA endonuclease SmrA [Marinagarivorans algicola]|uniref:DNA endonuclease SmrA n=1 Tax=Marinagarivorans algicola TaxID=1513270 RepID=UPI0006B942D7|nr:DNA endonuclease SmrA [Marinagarivorans algicola]
MTDDFLALLGGDVTPLVVAERVELNKSSVDPKALAQRREAAQLEAAIPDDPLSGDPIEMVEPMALLAFVRPGVQHGVYKSMRMGKYAIDARLDLHKMTVERARVIVYQFIKDCVANDVRTALITHGKGEGRKQPALLKSCVAYWLPQMDHVLAFHTAQKHHGSYGATYVLLKKSAAKKNKTREQYLKR